MKTCGATGCNFPVFSCGFCKQHQYMRNDDKYTKQKLQWHKTFSKGSTLNKRKKSKYGLKNAFKMKWGYDSQIEMFNDIWTIREHRSFLSDRSLDGYHVDMWINLFAHVLSKGKYPLYKLNPDNVVLLTPYEHQLFDQGTAEQRQRYQDKTPGCEWEKLYNYRDRLREEYGEMLKEI